jgi:NAD(P)H-nitrite reductase large subunit
VHYSYIIIGASAAGLAAANKLRSLDTEKSILCIAAQHEPPFNTCLIADFLAGVKTRSEILTKGDDFFTAQRIIFKPGTRVTHLDANAQQISTESGETFSYDTLLLATGTSMSAPPLFQTKAPGVFYFHTLADVEKIHAHCAAHNVTRAVIIGAGLSGVEAADALCQRGISVSIIEQQDHLLPRFLDKRAATFLEKLCVEHNVDVHTNSCVKSMNQESDHITGVTLTDGTIIPAQLIILALGGRPNLELAQQAQLTINDNALITNQFLQSSNPTIFAAGDIIALYDPLTNSSIRSSTWPDAVMQGMIAAHNMAGISKPYPPTVVMTSSRFFGTAFVSAGPIAAPTEADAQEEIVVGENHYYRFLLVEKKLKGVVMIGNLQSIGRIRRALQSQEPVTVAALLES